MLTQDRVRAVVIAVKPDDFATEQIEKVIEITRRLEQLSDVHELTDVLRPRS